jgi:integrase
MTAKNDSRRRIHIPEIEREYWRRVVFDEIFSREDVRNLVEQDLLPLWKATGSELKVVSNKEERDLITRADVPAIRFHDLRHTSATLLLAEGVHGKIVQERLGHANIAMTLDLYSHVTSDMQRHAAEALEAKIAKAEQRSA